MFSLDLVRKNCSKGSKEFGALSVDDPKATRKHGVEVVDPLKISFQMMPFVQIADQLRQCHMIHKLRLIVELEVSTRRPCALY